MTTSDLDGSGSSRRGLVGTGQAKACTCNSGSSYGTAAVFGGAARLRSLANFDHVVVIVPQTCPSRLAATNSVLLYCCQRG